MTMGDLPPALAAVAALALGIAAAMRPASRRILAGAALALLLAAAAMLAGRLPHPAPGQALAALAALAAAFAADAAIRRHVWYGRLAEGGRPRVPNIVIALASLAGYLLCGLLIASQILGLDVTAVAATSGVVAIVLGVSAQQTLGQVFAGLALNASRPFRIGDSVQLDGVWGVVTEADWRAVTLRSYEGTLITLPNTLVAQARLTNLGTAAGMVRHAIPFTADADVPPGRVREAALAALRGLPHVLARPAPLLLAKGFDATGVQYEALVWCRDANLTILRRDEAAQALWYGLHRAGIGLALHRRLLAAPEGAPPADAPEAWRARLPGALGAAALFASVPAEERAALAGRARRRLFADGETIMREGEAGESLFLVLAGAVSVRLAGPAGAEAEIYTQGVGEVVGHMSALTGEPRFATVRALGHVELAEFDRASLAPLVAGHPELVEAVAREILRIEAAEGRLRGAGAAAAPAMEGREETVLARLAERIRAFFGEARAR